MLWHIYSIVDGNLYAIYEEMLTLVEMHSHQQNEKIRQYEFFAWSKLIILQYKIVILKHRHEHCQDFIVYIKQYNTETGHQRLTLDSTRREGGGKPSNYLAKGQEKMLRAVSSKPE